MKLAAQELRIGNLIGFGSHVCQVYQIEENCFYVMNEKKESLKNTWADLNPIPLTEDWLLRMGFDYRIAGHKKHYSQGSRVNRLACTIKCYDESFWFREYPYATELVYVHQVQNLYFALTQTELTINQ